MVLIPTIDVAISNRTEFLVQAVTPLYRITPPEIDLIVSDGIGKHNLPRNIQPRKSTETFDLSHT